MKTIYLTRWLPASGKTTRAKLKQKELGNCKRVNKDDLRAMLDNSQWSKNNEKFVLQIRDMIVTEALKWWNHVIIDDTNFHEKHEDSMREIAKGHDARVEVVNFDTPLEECIQRDLKRHNSVWEAVIRNMYNQYIRKENPVIQDISLPHAILVDVDGTLAHMWDRGPYDTSKYSEDTVDTHIRYLVNTLSLAQNKIIICSWREDTYREITEKRLKDNWIPYDGIYMRPAGDKREDSIIKREILEKIVKEYYVVCVFDDRNRVVEMWRDAGLKCLQVADGNF